MLSFIKGMFKKTEKATEVELAEKLYDDLDDLIKNIMRSYTSLDAINGMDENSIKTWKAAYNAYEDSRQLCALMAKNMEEEQKFRKETEEKLDKLLEKVTSLTEL